MEEAAVANETIEKSDEQVLHRVKSLIAAHKRVFMGLDEAEQQAKKQEAQKSSDQLSCQNHHRVPCPACKAVATVDGKAFGKVTVDQESDRIVTRQAVMPERFSCAACGLKLQGYYELTAAELGDQYTRRITASPEDYYGLVDPHDIEQITSLAEEAFLEYNND